MRKDRTDTRILGKIDLDSIVSLFDHSSINTERIVEKGVVILWVDPDQEPTKHIFNDLPHLKKELDAWGGYFLFLTDPLQKWEGFENDELKSMPANLLIGHDNRIINLTAESLGSEGAGLPFVVMADKEGNIIYSSSGYRIGTGEQILRYACGGDR
jgi:hypothetical protein